MRKATAKRLRLAMAFASITPILARIRNNGKLENETESQEELDAEREVLLNAGHRFDEVGCVTQEESEPYGKGHQIPKENSSGKGDGSGEGQKEQHISFRDGTARGHKGPRPERG